MTRSKHGQRRRKVALLLADGMPIAEVARTLKLRAEVVEAERKAIEADPNNIDYLSPKRALGRLLDAYDALEREAREHLRVAVEQGKADVANRWFESIRRLTEDRGRVLHQIGVLNRATQEAARDDPEEPVERLSPRARKLMARIALAERLGHPWRADIVFEDTTALEPVPRETPPTAPVDAEEPG